MNTNKEKLIQFRKLVPIPLSEAGSYLSIRNWDIHKAVESFKNEKIHEITELTGENKTLVNKVYYEYKLDFNKTISFFKRKKEDIDFDKSRLIGLANNSFKIIDEWLRVENEEGLLSALCLNSTKQFIEILNKNLKMNTLGSKVNEALKFLSKYKINNFTLEQSTNFKLRDEFKQLEAQFKNDEIKFEEQLFLVRRNFENNRR